jgi:Ni/Fe-hydrogenase subunit HybB-like protein
MFVAGSSKPLKLGLGQFGPGWIATMVLLFLVFAFGLFAYATELIHGETVTGMRGIGIGGAGWGLYIVFVVFFVGVSFAGIFISAITRLFGLTFLKPIARMAELLTIVSLTLGAICIMADLGRPLQGLLNLPKYARVMSPFFGDFTLVVSGTLFATVVYFYLAGRADAAYLLKKVHFPPLRLYYRLWAFGFKGTPEDYNRHDNSSYWLALVILPLLVIAHSTVGFIFGIQSSRPGWFSPLQAPSFVVFAGVSGIGILIAIAVLIRKLLHLEDVISTKAIKWLGILLMGLSAVSLYFMAVEKLTEHYVEQAEVGLVARQTISGEYAALFWITVAGLLIPLLFLFAQYIRGTTNLTLHLMSGILVNVAAITKRYVLVIPSQTHGMALPYRYGHYAPSWVEISVIAGLAALGIMIYMVFIKVFPIVPLPTVDHEESLLQTRLKENRQSHIRRLLFFGATLAIGLVVAIAGFALSARIGTELNMDPLIPYSPILFIVGLVICFISAIVYEIIPEMKS